MMTSIKGSAVIEALAKRFPQLYVAPAEGAQDANRQASSRGIVPEGASLDHFITAAEDELRQVDTPAGPIEVVFLKNRADFETFLQIIGKKSRPDRIAKTIGAITYRGLADWGEVNRAREAYLAAGGDDWQSEFARQAQEPGAFRCELVVISEGPYSNVSASQAGYPHDEWLRISREIRLHHECAHVVCRRTMPDNVAPLWDEVTADVVGLICATGRYDAALAMRFLGVSETGYTEGRLVEYLNEQQLERVADIARETTAACMRIESEASAADYAHPFDFLLKLKETPLLAEPSAS